MTDIADVAVIGAGITGLSTAVNLRKRNVEKIVVIDAQDKIGSLKKASNINCGIVCSPAHFAPSPMSEEMCRRTIESIKDIEYVQFNESGALYPCTTDEEVAWAKGRVE